MSDFGDILGSVFGGGSSGDMAQGVTDLVAGLFGAERGNEDGEAPPIVYARYLCGGPKILGVNDR